MSITNIVKSKLTEGLEASYCEVVDDSDGCGAKLTVTVVSDKFQGKALLARHRLVNSLLVEELKNIHAFSQKPLTTQEWEAKKNSE